MSDNQACKPGIQLLIDEQVNDESLKGSFSLAKRNKGNLSLKNRMLHRLDKLAAQNVKQFYLIVDVSKHCNLLMKRLVHTRVYILLVRDCAITFGGLG